MSRKCTFGPPSYGKAKLCIADINIVNGFFFNNNYYTFTCFCCFAGMCKGQDINEVEELIYIKIVLSLRCIVIFCGRALDSIKNLILQREKQKEIEI